jgi:hypothetical protein
LAEPDDEEEEAGGRVGGYELGRNRGEFVFFVVVALFTDLLTDKVQPLSR